MTLTKKEQLEITQRAAISNFLINIIFALCLYAYAFTFISSIVHSHYWDIYASLLMVVGISIPTVCIVKYNPYPLTFYGVTSQGWRKAIKESILYTLPLLPLIVLGKWILIQVIPSAHTVHLFTGIFSSSFAMMQQQNKHYLIIVMAMMFLYIILTPIQEFIARGVLQGCLQRFLIGKHTALLAIIASNLIFSTFHLYLSLGYALSAFIPGLFWGWLYARHKNLIGVSVSHIIIGGWTIYIVGLRGLLV